MASRDRSVTSSPRTRDVIVVTTAADKHLTTVHSVLGNGSRDDAVETTSVLPRPTIAAAASGDRVTVLPEMTSSSTGSDDHDTPHRGRSTNYSADSIALVTVICVCMISLAIMLTITTAILYRYVTSYLI